MGLKQTMEGLGICQQRRRW